MPVRGSLGAGLAAVLVFWAATSWAADPAYYLRKSTWQETLLASETALAQQNLEDGLAPFESNVLRGGDPPQRVVLSVAGAREIFLFVVGSPDVKWGVADWAEAKLISADGTATALSEAPGSFKVLEGRAETNMTLRSGLYSAMRLQGRTFMQGVNVQAYSVLRVPLDGQYVRFEAWIGVDDWAGTNGSVRFSVTGAKSAARKRLWDLALRDFPDGQSRREMRWELEDRVFEPDWLTQGLSALARRYAAASYRIPPLASQATNLALEVKDSNGLAAVRSLYYRSRSWDQAIATARKFNYAALRLALEDLTATFADRYPKGPEYLNRVAALEPNLRSALSALPSTRSEDYEKAAQLSSDVHTLRDESLLSNPLLDFERLLVINRRPLGDPRRSQWEDRGLGEYLGLPKQSSWHLSTIPRTDNWDNEITTLSPVRPSGQLTTLFKPEKSQLLTEVDLHFDAQKLMFSMPDDHHRWQIYEINAQGRGLHQLTPGDQPEVHNYDSCYLPNDQIAFLSTAPLQGVPCNASVNVGMMYLMDSKGGNIHQVCFEQDHDYCPTVLNDGRVMYLRWDYTDTPHVWNRLLMCMNPDGTGQMEYYGSGSYWPNAIFFARPIPNHPTQVVGIVTGHHEGRVGELVVFDPARGRHEVEGVVQRIPGRGQPVEPKIEDKLTEHSWPKFLHPFPLSEKYFLVACKPEPDSLWGIYLVDVFDNLVLVREEEDALCWSRFLFGEAAAARYTG